MKKKEIIGVAVSIAIIVLSITYLLVRIYFG